MQVHESQGVAMDAAAAGGTPSLLYPSHRSMHYVTTAFESYNKTPARKSCEVIVRLVINRSEAVSGAPWLGSLCTTNRTFRGQPVLRSARNSAIFSDPKPNIGPRTSF